MEIFLRRKENGLPKKLRRVVKESKKIAVERNMLPEGLFALRKAEYRRVSRLFEEVSSRLCSLPVLKDLPGSQEFSNIYVVICGIPRQIKNPRLQDIGGVAVSKKLIGLYLNKLGSKKEPAFQSEVQWTVRSVFPHEFYHVVRMKTGAFGDTLKIGPRIVEEGLAQVFQAQELARVNPNWAMSWIVNRYNHVDDKCIAFAESLRPRLEEPIGTLEELKPGGGFPLYPFGLAFVASRLKEMGKSVMDPEILQMPAEEILAPWRKACPKSGYRFLPLDSLLNPRP